jgi:hypothetical protein
VKFRLPLPPGASLDNRPLLVAGQPETRTYTAIYVVDDQEIGLVSDAVAVVCKP